MGTSVSEVNVRPPAPPLRPFIESYVGYRLLGLEPGLHRGLPSRHLTFIVSVGDPIDVVAQCDAGQPPEVYGFVVGGLQASPALIAHRGDQEGVAIELTPLGARALFGMPARLLWNLSIEADQVLGRAAVELRERLHDTAAWGDRFEACDDVLRRCVGVPSGQAPEVREAWRLLVAAGGTVPVADLAAEVGWSRRHLAQRFTEELGLSPKLAARVIRFDRARTLLRRLDRPSFAEVAVACGYYDQPHLNRDFAEFAGCTPGEWLADEQLPSVQDGQLASRASSVA